MSRVEPSDRRVSTRVTLTLDDAHLVSFALGDAKVPKTNGFASQWNISFSKVKTAVEVSGVGVV